MPDRTAKSDRAVISLSPAVRDALNRRLKDLASIEGRSATQDQLIGALLAGVPLWQAEIMLRTYIRQATSVREDDA
jgi:hypothetical protein